MGRRTGRVPGMDKFAREELKSIVSWSKTFKEVFASHKFQPQISQSSAKKKKPAYLPVESTDKARKAASYNLNDDGWKKLVKKCHKIPRTRKNKCHVNTIFLHVEKIE